MLLPKRRDPPMAAINDMTVGSPTRGILRFALPLILGYILQQMYLIIDAAIVGRWIGVGALAAVGASSSIMFLIMGFLQRLLCRFRHPCGPGFRCQGLPEDAVVCGQRLAHRRRLCCRHHHCQLHALRQGPCPRQYPCRHLPRCLHFPLHAVPRHTTSP